MEGDSAEHIWNLKLDDGQMLSTIKIDLRWEDEPDQQVGLFRSYQNQGVEYDFTIEEGPTENQRNNPGIISIIQTFEHFEKGSQIGTGDYTFTITMNNAGDYQGVIFSSTDDGNDFSLEISTTVYVPL